MIKRRLKIPLLDLNGEFWYRRNSLRQHNRASRQFTPSGGNSIRYEEAFNLLAKISVAAHFVEYSKQLSSGGIIRLQSIAVEQNLFSTAIMMVVPITNSEPKNRIISRNL